MSGKLVLLGDFNVHLDNISNPEGRQLTVLLTSFGMEQHVCDSTHVDGHTLDLVVSRVTDEVVQCCEVGPFISDHNSILITLKSGKHQSIRKKTTFRKIKSIDLVKFSSEIQASSLNQPLDVNEKVSRYEKVLQELLDKHAPKKTRAIAVRQSQPWMNDDIAEAKRIRHSCERRWRKSKLTVHRLAYKESSDEVKKLIKQAKSTYFIKKIEECDRDQKKLQ